MKTNKRSRVISLLLCLVMMLGTLHTVAFAASEKPATRMVTQTLVPEEDDLPDGDMLFAGYLERQLYPEASDGVSLFGISAGDMLNEGGLEKAVYDDLKPKIEKVADGTISSTKFTVEADISALKWTKEQLGCEIVSGGSITEAAKNAVAEKFSSMLNTTTVLHALLADCPYELYWFDKTTGIKIGYETSGTSEEIEIKNLTLSFSVSGAYAGSADYTADTTKTGAAKSAVAEVLAVGYKNRFLKEKINIDTSSLLGRTLLDTMCIFDSNYDTNVIKKNILEINNLSIDGCYNFRLKEIKEKWKEIVALSNNYSAFFEEESVILDFLTYLMDAIPCLCDSVTVLVDLQKNNFQLVDGADRLVTKFETFLEKDDLAEQVLFNLICFNPNVVRYCGDMDELGEEFCYVVNEIFNVREFLDTKLQ